jgi:hypothetical protein
VKATFDQYLCIENPGELLDPRELEVLGMGSSDGSGIGLFRSGSKHAICTLLRRGEPPVIFIGNTKVEPGTREELVRGEIHQRVTIKLNNTKAKDTGFTTSMGVRDWKRDAWMALREFIANAIDGAVAAGKDHNAVRFSLEPKPRAKAGTTRVFVPLTPEVAAAYRLHKLCFLHFADPAELKQKVLPKRLPAAVNDGKETLCVFKKGVLVAKLRRKSVFDYNLGDELTLDESRKAEEWDVKTAVARAYRTAPAATLAGLLRAFGQDLDGELYEKSFDSYYLKPREKAEKEAFRDAFLLAYGDKAVLCSGDATAEFVTRKGHVPVVLPECWRIALAEAGVPEERAVLSGAELNGRELFPPTPEHVQAVNRVWAAYESFGLTAGKARPGVKAFKMIMSSESIARGFYILGEDWVGLHESLADCPELRKIAAEELAHYITGARDGARDLWDFAFRFIGEVV